MTIGEKILELRKKNGLSQEELGAKIEVTRQTISNWELDITTPNIEQLKMLSKEFNISIDDLVGNEIIYREKNKPNIVLEIIKYIIIFCICLFIILLLFSSFLTAKKKSIQRQMEESIYCKIYEEEHGLTIKYDEYDDMIIDIISDGYFYDILNLEKYNSAHKIFNIINNYVKKNSGTCEMIKDRYLNDILDMYIKEGTLTNHSATIIINDKNPNRIVYGASFWIEKYENGTWSNIKTTNNYGFDAIAYYANKDGILEMNQDWSHICGQLPKGIYRLVKDVFFESDIPVLENDMFYIWTEFEIE